MLANIDPFISQEVEKYFPDAEQIIQEATEIIHRHTEEEKEFQRYRTQEDYFLYQYVQIKEFMNLLKEHQTLEAEIRALQTKKQALEAGLRALKTAPCC